MKDDDSLLYVHELFPSFQGEGAYCGVPQLFIRLSGCNLACSYCDTPQARERTGTAWVSDWEGERPGIENPVRASELAEVAVTLWKAEMHSVSLTGGEPLLQAEALSALLPLLRERGMPVYLETNGTLYGAVEKLLPWLDFIAMDIKLPSFSGGVDHGDEHLLFLRAARAKELFLKMVVDDTTMPEEISRLCRRLGGEAADLTLVLQPAWRDVGAGLKPRHAWDLMLAAAPFFAAVRVMPQAHKAWGIR